MEKFRKLVDQFFCIPNAALLLFVVVVAMCLDAFSAKPMMPGMTKASTGALLLLVSDSLRGR